MTVLPHAQATQILFGDDGSLKATGIQVKRFGETLNYYANKETIISAGAIGTTHPLFKVSFDDLINVS